MEYVLRTSGLSKKYKNFSALNDVHMNVPKGSIYGFVGKNGAGKTTLIRVISGLQVPTSGSYSIYGISNEDSAINRARSRMGAVIESPAIYLNMTARDNIVAQYKLLGLSNDDGIEELLSLVGLADTGNKKAGHFSLGMRQRLGIAIALAGNPDFLILDEPINGLDPEGIVEMRELLIKLNHEMQITILISSHILELYRLERNEYYTIQIKNNIEQLAYRDILYILRDGKYAVFYLENGESRSVRKTLAQVFEEISKEYFFFADRGCIVNLANVVGLDAAGISFIHDKRVVISKAAIPEFKSRMLEFWGKQI